MNSFYNLLSQVNCNSNYVLLLNDGKAKVHAKDDTFIIESEVTGVCIPFEEISSVEWLNEKVLCTFECNEGAFEVELLVRHYFEECHFA